MSAATGRPAERATLHELIVADDPAAWRRAGFRVEAEEAVVGSVRLRFVAHEGRRGLLGLALGGLRSLELDGLPAVHSERPPPPRAPAHPNGAAAVDHVVAFSPDLDRSVAALQRAGLDLRRIREEPTPAGAPRQAFFRLGEPLLEVIQAPGVGPGTARAAGPARLWGLAFESVDLEAAAATFGAAIGPPREAVQPGRRIATVRREAGLAVPLAFMSPAPGGGRSA